MVRVSGKGSGRISIAGLLAYRVGKRPHLYYRYVVHRGLSRERRSLSEADYATLLTAAHQQLKAPIIVIWTTSTCTSVPGCGPSSTRTPTG